MKAQTFNIPGGCKTVTFEQVENKIITTFEPEIKFKFKEGDFIYSEWDDESAILISNRNYKVENGYIYYHACLNSCDEISYDKYIGHLYARTDRLATESEKQQLIEALARDGKMWDADKKAIVDLKYIPKVGDCVKLEYSGDIFYGEVKSINFDKIITYKVIKKGKIFDCEPIYWGLNVSVFKETKITREELQAEFNKIGYQYDFETHTASKMRWKPKYGETYYYVDRDCIIKSRVWYDYDFENGYFKIGNCYKTHEEAEPRQKHYLSFKD